MNALLWRQEYVERLFIELCLRNRFIFQPYSGAHLPLSPLDYEAYWKRANEIQDEIERKRKENSK